MTRPWFVVSLTVLVANDRFLKAAFGNTLTGKLSDVAGLALVSFVLSCCAARSKQPGPFQSVLIAGVAVFVGVKLSPSIGMGVENLLDAILPWSSRLVTDPTDLLALAVVPIAWWRGQTAGRTHGLLAGSLSLPWDQSETCGQNSGWGRVLRPVFGGIALLACLGSSNTDIEHWVYVWPDGTVGVYESRDGYYVSYLGSFATDLVDSDGSWNGQRGGTVSQSVGLEVSDLEVVGTSCQGGEPDHCVRLGDPFSIEETFNGGATWTTVWMLDLKSDYRNQAWVDRKLDYVEREAGVRQLVIGDDGTLVAIVSPDRFATRSVDGIWTGVDGAVFKVGGRVRPGLLGVIVWSLAGFAFLSFVLLALVGLLGKVSDRAYDFLGLLALVLLVGQVSLAGPLATIPLVIAVIAIYVLTLTGEIARGQRRLLMISRFLAIGVVGLAVIAVLAWQWKNDREISLWARLIHGWLVLGCWAGASTIWWLRPGAPGGARDLRY